MDEDDSPLIQAVTDGCLATVETLLAAGADVNENGGEDDDGATPLHFAAGEGHDGIASTLLQKGAEKEALDDNAQTPLFWACRGGHLPVVETLAAAGADLAGAVDEDGYAPVHVAASEGHDEIVSFLLKKGADEDAADDQEETPLCKAARGGHLPVAKTLLAADANVSGGWPGSAALHLAAGEGHCGIVSLLLEKGADKDALDDEDETPMCKAAYGGHLAVVETLVAAGADVNAGSSPLHLAAREGHGEIVAFLLMKGAEKEAINSNRHTPLIMAVGAGHIAVVKTLIAADVDICSADFYGFTALHAAVVNGHDEIAAILAQEGADKDALENRDDTTPLIMAASEGQLSMVETLAAAGADVNVRRAGDGTTALHCAVEHGYHKIVSVLLRNGADTDVRDKEGDDTPLMWALERSDVHVPIVEALLAAGADLNTRCGGRVALHIAASEGHDEIVSLMLKNGAAKDVLDFTGQTPLCRAVAEGRLAVVEILVAAGADVNARSSSDAVETVLHVAARGGHNKIVSSLLKKGADKDALDNQGDTPLRLAVENDHLTVVETLVAAGASLHVLSSYDGYSVLDWASEQGKVLMMQAILGGGADVDARDRRGDTALHKAIENYQQDAVDALLDAGADIEMKTRDNDSTPLWQAVAYDFRTAMLALLQRGADVNVPNADGITPLHRVCKDRDEDTEELVELLLKWGADEAALTDSGKSPADMLDTPHEDFEEPPLSQDGIERVRVILARAPANRAWRRRSWLCMLRARLSKAGTAGGDGDEGGSSKLLRPEDLKVGRHGAEGQARVLGGESAADGQNKDLTSAVVFLLGLELEGVFRAVVSFL